jgi:hypothetical protein
MVLIPDYYRGKLKDPKTDGVMDFLKEQTQWPKLKADWEDKILPHAKQLGAKAFGAIGRCHCVNCDGTW